VAVGGSSLTTTIIKATTVREAEEGEEVLTTVGEEVVVTLHREGEGDSITLGEDLPEATTAQLHRAARVGPGAEVGPLLEDEGIVTGAMETETVTVAMEVATIGVTDLTADPMGQDPDSTIPQ